MDDNGLKLVSGLETENVDLYESIIVSDTTIKFTIGKKTIERELNRLWYLGVVPDVEKWDPWVFVLVFKKEDGFTIFRFPQLTLSHYVIDECKYINNMLVRVEYDSPLKAFIHDVKKHYLKVSHEKEKNE